MSKYFDEAFGSNNPAAAVSPAAWAAAEEAATEPLAEEPLAEEPLVEPSAEAEASPEAPAPVTAASKNFHARPAATPKMIVPVSNTLRAQFSEGDEMEAFQESYRALRTRLLRLRSERGLRSVALTSAMKGEGKTMTSLHLAHSCARLQEMRVLLVDCDIRTFGLSRLLRAHDGKGVSDILSGRAEPEQVVLSTDVPNLQFLPGGVEGGAPAELLASRRWSRLIDWCSETFSLVIIDTPPILNLTDVELITACCDGTVMVVRSQETMAEHLKESAACVDSKKLLGVILNGSYARKEAYKYGYGKSQPLIADEDTPSGS
jgi:protein-tyrosine kinase